MTKRSVSILMGLTLTFLAIQKTYAWSNYFRFINNFNHPMVLSIKPDFAIVNSTCRGGIDHIEVNAKSSSCEIEFATDKEHWYSPEENSGMIKISDKNDPSSYCTYYYYYTYKLVPYSYFDIHSEVISPGDCRGNLKSSEISVISDHNQALIRPLSGNVLLSKAYESTESQSQADCGGGDNCMVASPDLSTSYVNQGSTLAQSLYLQADLDQYQPLNFKQFIGSHNSAISRQYTQSSKAFNLSYADPDNYLTLTQMLNAGVRQIELDIEWYNGAMAICHNHVSSNLNNLLCDGNTPLNSVLSEINAWLEKNPDALLLLYLDVNLPLDGHVSELDNNLSQLEPHVFTPAMAEQYYHTLHNTLPIHKLSQYKLTHQFKKNIIITNDNDIDNLQSSRYVFVHTQDTTTPLLYHKSLDTLLNDNLACHDENKYLSVKNEFSEDPKHVNLLRINSDRTVINYVTSAKSSSPDKYNNYFTTHNLTRFLMCPINIFSTNMLGFTCDSSSCDAHPTDPRFYSFLWSWELGYPLQVGGSDIAYINPATNHFENKILHENNVYSILCTHAASEIKSPTQTLPWYLEEIKIKSIDHIDEEANSACQKSNGTFAAPTTSYWMHDAMLTINKKGINPYPVIINYRKLGDKWVSTEISRTN